MKKAYKKPEAEVITQMGDILTLSNELEPIGITFGTVNDGVNDTVKDNF